MLINFSHVVENEYSSTQRGSLKTTASIFDPVGIGSPVTILAKIVYRKVCLKKLGWDAQIPSELAKLWDSWIKGLDKHPDLEYNQCVITHLDEPILDIKLHDFADASLKEAVTQNYS